jgi:hypothetical protein
MHHFSDSWEAGQGRNIAFYLLLSCVPLFATSPFSSLGQDRFFEVTVPRFLGASVLLAGLFLLIAPQSAGAQEMTDGGVIVPTLKQQLTTGLLARTPSDKAFIDEVVQKVNDGDLPLSLVQSTFLWARRKMPYPMPYFQQALKLRAKQQGIQL